MKYIEKVMKEGYTNKHDEDRPSKDDHKRHSVSVGGVTERIDKNLKVCKDSKKQDKERVLKLEESASLLSEIGKEFDYLVDLVGEKSFEKVICLIFSFDLTKLNDDDIQRILSLVNLIVMNSHLHACRSWVDLGFSSRIWFKLSKMFLRNLFTTYPSFTKEYEQLKKKTADELELKAASFLDSLVTLFSHKFASLSFDILEKEVKTCEKILEFLLVSLSCTYSRLATLMIMQDREFLVKHSLFNKYLHSKYFEDAKSIKQLENIHPFLKVLKRFVTFDIMGESRLAKSTILVHYDTFQEFQRLLFTNFAEKVEPYVVKAVGSADTREKLAEVFSYLQEQDLRVLASKLNIFIPEIDENDPILGILTEQEGPKLIIEEILIGRLKARKSMIQQVREVPLYPTETDIWESQNYLKNLDGDADVDWTRGFPIDRVTHTFINTEDYLIRYYNLWRYAFSLETKKLVEEAVRMMHPEFDKNTGIVKEFNGWCQQAIEIKEFTVFEVEKPKVGENVPSKILAEINYSTVEMNAVSRKEWETIKETESVFLLSLNKKQQDIVNELEKGKGTENDGFLAKSGVALVRGCEVVSHLDEERNKINTSEFRQKAEIKKLGYRRHLQIFLEPSQYSKDLSSLGRATPDRGYSVALKRAQKSHIYPAYLKLILNFLDKGIPLPEWVNNIVIGKPSKRGMDEEEIKKIDLSHFERLSLHCSDSIKQALSSSLKTGLSIVEGGPGTGKSLFCAELIQQLLKANPEERIVIVTSSENAVSDVINILARFGVLRMDEVVRLGEAKRDKKTELDYSRYGRVNLMLKNRMDLLVEAQHVAADIGLDLFSSLTCETAEILFKSQIEPRWKAFLEELKAKNNDTPFPFGRQDLKRTLLYSKRRIRNGESKEHRRPK